MKHWITYKKAQEIVQSYKIKTTREYRKWKARPSFIPSEPNIIYAASGWVSWHEYLGTGNVATKLKSFVSYEEARDIARDYNIKSRREYQDLKNRPANLPANPNRTYVKKGWVSWGKFLGTGNVVTRSWHFASYEKARNIVSARGIKSKRKYHNWNERPNIIPGEPNIIYAASGWVSWHEYLGKQKPRRN